MTRTELIYVVLSLSLLFASANQVTETYLGGNEFSGDVQYPTENNSVGFPGYRYKSSTWISKDGCLYLFGGSVEKDKGYRELNDMWKYDPSTSQWHLVHPNQANGSICC